MFLGIDLGTSSVKFLVLNKEGSIVKTLSKDYPVNYFNNNWAEQNPNHWWEKVLEGLNEISNCKDISKRLEGISFSGQMHGLVLLDKNDEIIRPAILWCDQRSEKECEELKKIKDFEKITGNQPLTGFTAPKILWVKKNEYDNFKKIDKIMLPKDYIAYKLSGIHGIDVSDCSGTLLMNVKNRTWSKEIIEALGINFNSLGKIYESSEIIGTLKENLKEKFGFEKNIKIIMGGGDQAMGAIGVGAIKEGTISLALGTSGVVFSPTDEYKVDLKYRLHSFCDGNGKYHQMGVTLSGASALKWWVEDVNNSKDYEFYNNLAKNILPGSDQLYFLPYLIGERTPHNNPHIRGGFIGLTHNHHKGHMTRAILEGVAFSLKDCFSLLNNLNLKEDKILISGGGSKSSLWKQILADVIGKPIITIDSASEGPALGCAIIASVACNNFSSIEEACKKIIKEIHTTYPVKENINIYKDSYEKYKKLYEPLKNFWS